jgi:hypothetical protein
MSTIANALLQIQNLGLDKIRCYLTGAPYAQIDSSEIAIALQAEIEHDENVTVDRLVDNWQLKALSFNSQTLPSLRGVKDKALMPLMRTGQTGQVKTLTYMLTRLLFPHLGSEPLPSDVQADRMLFAVHLYDTAMTWEVTQVTEYVQQLVIVDAYCAMPYWHTIWAFESAFSKFGLAKAPKRIQETFADPLRVTEDMSRIRELIVFMYKLMLHVTERDGVAGKSGNRLAQQIMLIQAAHLPKMTIPHFQKQLSEADRFRLEERRKIESRNELRVAWSATNGKGHLPNDFTKQAAARIAKSMEKKSSEAKPKDSKPKASTAKIDPRFAAAFKALVK